MPGFEPRWVWHEPILTFNYSAILPPPPKSAERWQRHSQRKGVKIKMGGGTVAPGGVWGLRKKNPPHDPSGWKRVKIPFSQEVSEGQTDLPSNLKAAGMTDLRLWKHAPGDRKWSDGFGARESGAEALAAAMSSTGRLGRHRREQHLERFRASASPEKHGGEKKAACCAC